MLAINYTSDLQVRSDREIVDQTFFNKRYKSIYNSLVHLDARQQVYDATVNTLIETELQRMNDLLGPMMAQIENASSLGFLWGKSIGTAISLVVGEAEGFVITENAAIFTPTPVLLVQDITDTTNWGLVTLDEGGWTKQTGDLATHCIYKSKTKSSTQWFISASAAIFPAMLDVLADAQAARDAAIAAQATVSAEMGNLEDLAAAIEAGPVASVAGRTGVVTLTQSDISGLTSDLAAKASSSTVTAQLAGKQDTNAKLTTMANLVWAANKILYATSPSTISTLDITDFAKTILDDANATTTLSTLGVSAFIKTLLDDVDQASAQATLGIATALSKATSADAIAGTEDTKYLTALSAAAAYKTLQIGPVQSAGFTFTPSFNGQVIPWTNASAGIITLSNTAPAGTQGLICQEGAGQITFAAQAGGTVQSRGSRFKSNGQFSMITAYVYSNAGGSAAAWRLGGDLVA